MKGDKLFLLPKKLITSSLSKFVLYCLVDIDKKTMTILKFLTNNDDEQGFYVCKIW